MDGIILPSAGMTKWFPNAVYFTYLKTVFLLSSVYRLIHYKYAGEQLHHFSRVFFFPIFSSLMLYDELQCYRYYPLYAMNDVAEQNKNVRELSRAFFSIAADN